MGHSVWHIGYAARLSAAAISPAARHNADAVQPMCCQVLILGSGAPTSQGNGKRATAEREAAGKE